MEPPPLGSAPFSTGLSSLWVLTYLLMHPCNNNKDFSEPYTKWQRLSHKKMTSSRGRQTLE